MGVQRRLTTAALENRPMRMRATRRFSTLPTAPAGPGTGEERSRYQSPDPKACGQPPEAACACRGGCPQASDLAGDLVEAQQAVTAPAGGEEPGLGWHGRRGLFEERLKPPRCEDAVAPAREPRRAGEGVDPRRRSRRVWEVVPRV